MTQPGIGSMIGHLFGHHENNAAFEAAKDRLIIGAKVVDEGDGSLVLTFEGCGQLTISDDGRSCCESRYITTDDDVSDLVGKRLHSVVLKDGPEEFSEWGDPHETAFVEVIGHDGTSVTLTTHNEHNGYYGGFCIRLSAQGMSTEGENSRSEVEGEACQPDPEGDAPNPNRSHP